MKIDQETAIRLGEYLEQAGWSVWAGSDELVSTCLCGNMVDTNFCPTCGRKNEKLGADVIRLLEAALTYALSTYCQN